MNAETFGGPVELTLIPPTYFGPGFRVERTGFPPVFEFLVALMEGTLLIGLFTSELVSGSDCSTVISPLVFEGLDEGRPLWVLRLQEHLRPCEQF